MINIFANFKYFMIKNKFIIISWILFFLFIISYLLYNSFSYLDNDLGWHLKVGEEIWHNKSVPQYDNYDYILEGQKWVDHEWLINLVCYLIYNNFGYGLLTLFFALIGITLFIIITVFLRREFLSGHLGGDTILMLLLFLGALAMSPHFGVRMQEVTMLFFALLLIVIHYYNRSGDYRLLFFLPPLFWFWACLHGGFLIGFFILFFWLAVKIAERLLSRYKFFRIFSFDQPATDRQLFLFLAFTFLSLLATFFTPYGIKLYAFLKDYSDTYYQTAIQEWQPFYYLPIQYWQIIYASIFSAAYFLYFLFAYNGQRDSEGKPIRLDPWRSLLSLLFLFLALKSKRHFPLFFIASSLFLAEFCRYFFVIPEKSARFFRGSIIVRTYFIAAMLIMIGFTLYKSEFNNNPFDLQGPYCDGYPCAALKNIKDDASLGDLKIFNNYDWGGFLIWAWPEKKLFIDGRLPQYPFKGHTLLEEYHDFYYEDTLAEKLKEYDIGIAFLKKPIAMHVNWIEKYLLSYDEEVLNHNILDNKLIKYLDNSKDWKQVFADDISLVYVKK